MHFIFVEFWVTVDFMRYGVNHGHWHFVLGIEIKQTNCTFQFNRYFSEASCILRGRIDNASVVFLKSVSILNSYTRIIYYMRKPDMFAYMRKQRHSSVGRGQFIRTGENLKKGVKEDRSQWVSRDRHST